SRLGVPQAAKVSSNSPAIQRIGFSMMFGVRRSSGAANVIGKASENQASRNYA
ncbi:MAG: hypothetical protein ACI9AQ_002872, partial [Dinoroseobacter sp.]